MDTDKFYSWLTTAAPSLFCCWSAAEAAHMALRSCSLCQKIMSRRWGGRMCIRVQGAKVWLDRPHTLGGGGGRKKRAAPNRDVLRPVHLAHKSSCQLCFLANHPSYHFLIPSLFGLALTPTRPTLRREGGGGGREGEGGTYNFTFTPGPAAESTDNKQKMHLLPAQQNCKNVSGMRL